MRDDSARTLRNAADVLGLGTKASREEMKRAYRACLKKWHPDTCEEDEATCREKTREATRAYETLLAYADTYPIPLHRDVSATTNDDPAEYWRKRFADDPLWGKPGTERE